MYWYYKYIIIALALTGVGFGVFKLLPDDFLTSQEQPSTDENAPPSSNKEELNSNKALEPNVEKTVKTVEEFKKTSFATPSSKYDSLFQKGIELKKNGMLDSAYDIFIECLSMCDEYSPEWQASANEISKINIYIYKNSVPSKRKQSYSVKTGQTLWDFANNNTTIRAVQVSNKIPLDSSVIHANQVLNFFGGDWEIKVSKSNFALQLLLDGKLFRFYKIGIGKDNRTPIGQFIIKGKKREPTWKGYPFGHPENVLGTRWMRLTKISDGSNEGYGIHGTQEPESIGTASSLGCLRMRNEDVEELYDFIPDNKIKVTIED